MASPSGSTTQTAHLVAKRKALIDEVLEAYPQKARKRRAKHLGVTKEDKSDFSFTNPR